MKSWAEIRLVKTEDDERGQIEFKASDPAAAVDALAGLIGRCAGMLGLTKTGLLCRLAVVVTLSEREEEDHGKL